MEPLFRIIYSSFQYITNVMIGHLRDTSMKSMIFLALQKFWPIRTK